MVRPTWRVSLSKLPMWSRHSSCSQALAWEFTVCHANVAGRFQSRYSTEHVQVSTRWTSSGVHWLAL